MRTEAERSAALDEAHLRLSDVDLLDIACDAREVVCLPSRVDLRFAPERPVATNHTRHRATGVAFSCETHSESVSGADRDTEFDTRRVVTYRPGPQPIIRVQVSSARAEGRRRRFGSADYQFDGRVFVADPDVCAF